MAVILLENNVDYEVYIQSVEWAKKREARLLLDRHQCQTCGEATNLEVHHIYQGPPNFKYKTTLGDENIERDLITLCQWCHEAITNSVRQRRFETANHPELKVVSTSVSKEFSKEITQYPQLRKIENGKNISNSGGKAYADAQQPAFRPIK